MHTKSYEILHKLQIIFFRLALWIELFVALLIFVGIVIHFSRLPAELGEIMGGGFNEFLHYLLDALVGIEVAMMLCRHDLDSIVEVMIFAVTKSLIINHENSIGILIGVVAVAVLFAIRKFLFLSAVDLAERKKHADYIQREK